MLSNKNVLPNFLKSIIFATAAMLSFNVSAGDTQSLDLSIDENASQVNDLDNSLTIEREDSSEAELAAEKEKMEKEAEMAKDAELNKQ